MLTCSTLGPVAHALSDTLSVPVRRVDRALAQEAMRDGPSIVALCAIANAAQDAYAQGADCVALAQASMADAAALARAGKTPLSSPAAGLRAAMAAMDTSKA